MTNSSTEHKAIAAELTTVSAEYREGEESFAKGVTYRAAVLTSKALKSGFLAAKGGVMTPGDYAANFGKSATWVSRMKRLARATDVGFTPDHSEWVTLCRTASDKIVSDALMDEKATMAKIRKALAANNRAQQEKAKGTQKNGASSRKAKPNDGTPKSDGDTVTLTGTTAQRVGVLLTALDTAVKELTLDDWATVTDRLEAMITRENTIRAKAAATPKKVTATPATVAKKATARKAA